MSDRATVDPKRSSEPPAVSVVVTFATLPDAYACLAEIRRLFDAHVWLEVEIVRRTEPATVRVSARRWPHVRSIIRRFGGRTVD